MAYEQKADELLKALGQELHKERIRFFNQFDEKKDHASVNMKKNKKRHARLAWVAVLCICVIALGVTTGTSDAFRTSLFSFFFSEEEGHSDMIGEDSGRQDIHIRYPQFLPEGYTKTAEDDFGTMHTLTYENKETGDAISITQINDKSFSMSIDTESSEREECMVKTYEAYFVGGNENHMLIWEEQGVYFEITSMLDKNVLIKIANSLK